MRALGIVCRVALIALLSACVALWLSGGPNNVEIEK